MGRVLANEHPELFGGLVDLEPSEDPHAQAALLVDTIYRPDEEKQIAFRHRQRYVARLAPVPKSVAAVPARRIREDATYLIAGGLGGLGLVVARWLVARGARHLVLSGRSHPSAAAADTIADLEREGTTILVTQSDIASTEQTASLLSRAELAMPPLRGVIHAAGTFDDGVLLQQNWTRFAKVLSPKVEGAWNLHALTQHIDLDFFVLFSSASALLGPPGQANYAAANAFLDALGHQRRAQGLTALTINWGPWAEVGLAAAQANGGAAKFPAKNYRDWLISRFPGGASAFTGALAKGMGSGSVLARTSGAAKASLGSSIPKAIEGTGEYFLIVYPHAVLGAGAGANKPWLQELPDPVSKICWQSWSC
jgi:NAD(P)-dependent dehydrogenase (short-subunit alcohol dehydrogenase family)